MLESVQYPSKRGEYMKQGSTLILRTAVTLMSLAVLALCIFLLPAGLRTDNVGGYKAIILGMYVTAIPFFIAVYHVWNLLGYIDKNKAFSDLSVKSLDAIKYCAITISILYAAGMPYVFIVADRDDAPGVVLIGLIITAASAVIGTFAAVLQKLVTNAITVKSENELTV